MPYLLNTECFWITYVYTHRSKHARNHRRISKMTSPLEVWQGIGAADRGRVPQHGLHITLRMTPFYPGHYRLHWTPPGYCRLLHEYLRVFTDLTATFNAYRAGSGAVVYKHCGWDEANILDDFTSKTMIRCITYLTCFSHCQTPCETALPQNHCIMPLHIGILTPSNVNTDPYYACMRVKIALDGEG